MSQNTRVPRIVTCDSNACWIAVPNEDQIANDVVQGHALVYQDVQLVPGESETVAIVPRRRYQGDKIDDKVVDRVFEEITIARDGSSPNNTL